MNNAAFSTLLKKTELNSLFHNKQCTPFYMSSIIIISHKHAIENGLNEAMLSTRNKRSFTFKIMKT